MPPSKSKVRKRKQKPRQSGMERLARKVAQGPMPPAQIVIEPEGQVKKSKQGHRRAASQRVSRHRHGQNTSQRG
jgi:hypothetical protein